MRRLVALLVLCLLPLQWTYAAVADYCQHEAAKTAQQHLGHHAHEHVASPAEDPESKKGLSDLDCPSCHHSTGAVMPGIAADALSAAAPQLLVFSSRAIPQRAPDNPFRPPLIAAS